MHIRNTTLSKALALLAAGLVVASFTINNVVLAGTLVCTQTTAGVSGCTTGTGCPFYEPNVGITPNQTEQCTYNSATGQLTSDVVVGACTKPLNGGCCNNIAAGTCPVLKTVTPLLNRVTAVSITPDPQPASAKDMVGAGTSGVSQ